MMLTRLNLERPPPSVLAAVRLVYRGLSACLLLSLVVRPFDSDRKPGFTHFQAERQRTCLVR